MSIQQYNPKIANEIAQELLKVEAIKLRPENPFDWASGWKSPIYCDNRLSLSFPATRTLVKKYLAQLIKEKFPKVECIAGVATAGIPQGALVAEELGLPFIYVRSKTKEHGMGNQIEGKVIQNAQVVLIEDLISTGGSSLQASEAVRHAGMNILGMAAIFTYGFPVSQENFEKHNIDLWYLSDYATIVNSMLDAGTIKPELEATLNAWRGNPAQWNQ
ncbi:MAG: orotate phosphoribosyltransferase [Cyclobacteriaceae bacterium]